MRNEGKENLADYGVGYAYSRHEDRAGGFHLPDGYGQSAY